MKDVIAMGVDLAKLVIHVVGMNEKGGVELKKRLGRGEFLSWMGEKRNLLVGMEACGGSHYWAREVEKQGHRVRLVAPQFVKPYVKSNKNDMADAEAICESILRPTMRFVSVKTVEQQDLQMLHRVRQRLVRARTSLVNEIRGFGLEYGMVLPKGLSKFRNRFTEEYQRCAEGLSSLAREIFDKLYAEYLHLEEKISEYEKKLKAIAKAHPECRRLQSIPGVAEVTATAVMTVDVTKFANGRAFAASLGVVPRQYSTGGKERLLGISKRGDVYLRTLLIHGARSVLIHLGSKTDRRSRWARRLVEEKGMNRAAVALANKNARVIWAVLKRGEEYREFPAAA